MGIPLDTRSRNGLNNVTEQSRNSSSPSRGSLDSATPEEWDRVSKPKHYRSHHDEYPELECIDAIQASMPPDQFAAYLKGSAMKYLWRYENKGEPLNDLRKAKTFIEFLIAHVNQQ